MRSIFLLVLIAFSIALFSQQKQTNLPRINSEQQKKEISKTEAEYRTAKAKNVKRATNSYNLGNTIYKQNQYSEAKSTFLKSVENAKGKQQKHFAYHNLGNVYMKEKDYANAVEAYKNALRSNPNDEKTRYNLALAKKSQKENPIKKNGKEEENPDKNKKKEDQKENNKPENQKSPNNKPDQNNNQNPVPEKPKPEPKEGKIPKDRIKNLLDAVDNEEKKVQIKVNGKKEKGKPNNNEKDW